jgi:Chaperone of endosialidase
MKKILLVIFASSFTFAQVGIGTTTPNASSVLEMRSTTRGLLPPRVTETERNAIASPEKGLLVYQTTTPNGFYYFDGTAWKILQSINGWNIFGNNNTSGTPKLGTLNNFPFIFKANNNEVMRVNTNGRVAINHTDSGESLLKIKDPSKVVINQSFESNSLAPFTTNGSGGNWTVTNNQGKAYKGSFGAQSGTGVDSGISNLTYTVNLTSNANLFFTYKCNTEIGSDYLRIYIDGNLVGEYTGLTNWQTVSFPLTTGLHNIRWAYEKDSSRNEYLDRVFLDDIIITYPSSLLRIQDGFEQNNYVMVSSDGNGRGRWTNPQTIAVADDDWRFNSGNTVNDPIYRLGNVSVGITYGTFVPLTIGNGTETGTEVGLGSNEYILDGVFETRLSHSFLPQTDNSIGLGSAARKFTQVFATNGVINTSDSRDKENIEPLQYGMQEINKLNPITYNWKKEQHGKTIVSPLDKKQKIGFKAQELFSVLPETILNTYWTFNPKQKTYSQEKTPELGVMHNQIVPVLVNSIQEHQKKLEELNKKLLEIEKNLENK